MINFCLKRYDKYDKLAEKVKNIDQTGFVLKTT